MNDDHDELHPDDVIHAFTQLGFRIRQWPISDIFRMRTIVAKPPEDLEPAQRLIDAMLHGGWEIENIPSGDFVFYRRRLNDEPN